MDFTGDCLIRLLAYPRLTIKVNTECTGYIFECDGKILDGSYWSVKDAVFEACIFFGIQANVEQWKQLELNRAK